MRQIKVRVRVAGTQASRWGSSGNHTDQGTFSDSNVGTVHIQVKETELNCER